MANEKILVVDDDANICELLRLYLTKEGYQVTTAGDGEEGLEKFNHIKPDMVLLDVMMPRMDGLEVCRRIRKAGNTPVMMLTAPISATKYALKKAGMKLDDIDLVEISPTAQPPVCRLMDYGKFKYQEQKRAAEAKAKQHVIDVKEVKFRPGTDEGDYNIKMRNLRRFLEDGDKGKVTLRFRGREITHQDIGMRLLERVRDELTDVSLVEHMPKLEGRQMIMVLAPKRKK